MVPGWDADWTKTGVLALGFENTAGADTQGSI